MRWFGFEFGFCGAAGEACPTVVQCLVCWRRAGFACRPTLLVVTVEPIDDAIKAFDEVNWTAAA